MSLPDAYSCNAPSGAEIAALEGVALLEFGTNWCGWCRAAAPLLAEALAASPRLRHIRVEDGPGRRLGRAFGVKLWPTLIFLRDGSEVARLVRPASAAQIRQILVQIDPNA